VSTLGKAVAAVVALALFGFLVWVPLPWQEQAKIGVVMFVAALALHWSSRSRAVTVMLMLFSMFASLRYFVWRVGETWRYWSASGTSAIGWDLIFVVLLLLAETYALTILALGYFQSARPLQRKPFPLPADPASWPAVDVFIPTYNEPLDLVRATVTASRLLDWPAEKLRVYVLDDGNRADFKQYCEESGVGYFARADNKHAKAGNINHAFWKTTGEYLLILDCDHIPTRSFLQMTMGWLVHDPKIAMLQTPHHFYSPDPFERNLDTFRQVPNEGNLFYGVVQDGNDLWNAAFFCGSAAVLRRAALEEIGGIAVETVTEDAHTSLRLQRRGWNTAYVNLPLIGGLATASLADHITQRVRWARGMVQILRIENPLFSGGLSFAQRLCYFNCMIHFLYAVPRLIFLTSPLIYLLLGFSNFYGSVAAISAFAFPHLALALLANTRVQGRFRHTFWNEIYETVLSPYIVLPTLLALIHPQWGKFNVTPKTRAVDQTFLDWRIATPFIVLLLINLVGLAVGIPRLFLETGYTGTVAVNVFWTLFNAWTLAAAIAASQEKRQMRASERLPMVMPATVRIASGAQAAGETVNLSWHGVAVQVHGIDISRGDRVAVAVTGPGVSGEFGGTVVQVARGVIRVAFLPLSRSQEQRLTRLLFGRADSWLHWRAPIAADQPVRSLFRILGLAFRGVGAMMFDSFRLMRPVSAEHEPVRARGSVVLPLLILAAVLLSFLAVRGWAAPAPRFSETTSLTELGLPKGLEIRGLSGQASMPFYLPVTKLVSQGRLRLRYRAASGLTPTKSVFRISMNGTPVAELPLTNAQQEASMDLPSELFVSENSIQVALAGECADCEAATMRTVIEATTSIEINGNFVQLASDVALLPAPFFLPSSQRSLKLPFVFDAPPDSATLEAAGVVASWFGALTDHRGVSFPVASGDLPAGNIVVFTKPDSPLALQLGLGVVTGPTLAIRDNPKDQYSKVLVVVGATGADLLTVARALALGRIEGSGASVSVVAAALPEPRRAYDAPRWVRSAGLVPLVTPDSAEQYRVYGDGVAQVFFRLAPDLYFDTQTSVPLTVAIDVTNLGVARANVPVLLNGQKLGTMDLAPGDAGKTVTRTFVAPITALYPRNTLSIQFSYRGAGGAGVVPVARVRMGTQLDLRNVPHFVRLPRLDLFAKAGFPFTQMADLSTTAVVLPARPASAQIGTYLETVAFLSAQTGYPGTRLSVINAQQAERSTKDLLVIGAAGDQPLFDAWAGTMPVQVARDAWTLSSSGNWLGQLWARPFGRSLSAEDALREQLASSRGEVLIQGFAHPASNGRAVVAISTRNAAVRPAMFQVLDQVSASTDGASSVIVGGATQAFSTDIAAPAVDRGRLAGVGPLYNWIGQNALVVPAAALLLAALLGAGLSRGFDRRAEARLGTRA
jgi:cellulose synthase (UDP-forming)